MADSFTEEAFEAIGEDFETLMGGLKPVTVASVNPDTLAVLVSVADVPALKRVRKRTPFMEVSADTCRFLFRASRCEFLLKHKDTVTDADGVVWVVDERGASLIAFKNLWAVDVTRKRV